MSGWVWFCGFLAAMMVFSAAVAAGRAVTCPAGWGAWICYHVALLQSRVISHWRATNLCTIPEDGPAIVVANHTSPVDPPLLWIRHFAAFRRPRLRVIGFMMAQEYFGRGLVRWTCQTMESIPVARSGRDMAPLREALRRLEAGKLLGIFPEGRLNVKSPDEQLLPGGTGAAWLALKSGAPVIPVFIRGAPRHPRILKAFFTRSHTTVTYGPPVDLSPWQGHKPDQKTLTEATNAIMSAIAGLGGIRFTPLSPTAADHDCEASQETDPSQSVTAQ